MDDEQQTAKRSSNFGRIVWLLVIAAVVFIWWHFREPTSTKVDQIKATDAEAQLAIDRDDVLVDLKDNATPDQVAAIEKQIGTKLELVDSTGEAQQTQLYRAHVTEATEEAVIAALQANTLVEVAEPDSDMQLDPSEVAEVTETPATQPGFPNDPDYKYQWHLRQIGMPDAWKLSDGNGVIVAVLDTGVAYEDYKKFHQLPDLKGLTFVEPYDFVTNTPHADDDHAVTIGQLPRVGHPDLAEVPLVLVVRVVREAGLGGRGLRHFRDLARIELHVRVGLGDLDERVRLERRDHRFLGRLGDVRAIELGLLRLAGRIDQLELRSGLLLDRGDLIGRRVVLQIDEHVIAIDRELRLGICRLYLIDLRRGRLAEVPPDEHDRRDHQEPHDAAEIARSLGRLLLVVHDDKYKA